MVVGSVDNYHSTIREGTNCEQNKPNHGLFQILIKQQWLWESNFQGLYLALSVKFCRVFQQIHNQIVLGF